MTLALQKALLAAGNTALAPAKLYEKVPRTASLPFARIANITSVDAGVIDRILDETFIYIEVRSDYSGNYEARSLIKKLRGLDRQYLTLDTGERVMLLRRSDSVVQDADGETYLGRISFRCVVAA